MTDTIPESCKRRHHAYPANAKAGDPCAGCGKAYGTRSLGAERSQALLKVFNGGKDADPTPTADIPPTEPRTPAPTALTPAVGAAPSPEARPNSVHQWLAARLTFLTETLTAWCVRRAGYEPNRPNRTDVAQLEDGMARQMAAWFPDSALTPWAQIGLAYLFMLGEMCVNAKRLPKPGAAAPATAPSPTAGASVPPAAPPPPEPRATPAPNLESELDEASRELERGAA